MAQRCVYCSLPPYHNLCYSSPRPNEVLDDSISQKMVMSKHTDLFTSRSPLASTAVECDVIPILTPPMPNAGMAVKRMSFEDIGEII